MARARGSHRPSLVRVAERAILDHDLVPHGAAPGGGRLLVACSGGPDSSALLHVLARLAPRLGFQLVAHGVDHGLRVEARDELEGAARLAAELGVPFAITRVDVSAGGNLQARARRARYDALVAVAIACGAGAIATAHTADDRAETLIIRLLRGAGPRGLAVLPPRAPAPVKSPAEAKVDLVRPLLCARRADVVAYVKRNGLRVSSDPSNDDPRFVRVRVRRDVLPGLEAIAPRVVEHLCALADMLGSLGADDDPLAGLGRAQRLAVERARSLGRSGVHLRVRGGREVIASFDADGSTRLQEAAKTARTSAPVAEPAPSDPVRTSSGTR